MNEELKSLLKKALKDASGDVFYKLDKKTFMQKVFDTYCESWFEENMNAINQINEWFPVKATKL